MADPLRVLCVGAGYFAAFQHRAWAELDGAEVVGIVDLDPAKARHAAAMIGGPPAFPNMTQALDALAVDLVDIAVPPAAHLDLIDEASAAGHAIVCQKPLCGTIDAARSAVSLAEKRDVPLIIHENFRFQPWWRRVRAEIDGGGLGRLFGVSFRLRPGDGQGPRAYLDRQPYFQDMPRLLVHETAVHFVDVFRYLLGEPEWVQADLRRLNPAIRGEDAGIFVMGFPDGVRALFDGNRLADHPAENRRLVMGEGAVEGSDATLTLTGDGTVRHRLHGRNDGVALPVPIRGDRFGGGCVEALQSHVLAHLREGAPAENTGRAYLRNMEIVEAIYRAAESGCREALN